ncbi:MAG: hypothetical protein ACOC4C_01195 [Fibrobacterota bacterium]
MCTQRIAPIDFRWLLVLLLLLLVFCSGGFDGDSDNVSEFENPLFHSDSTETE